MSEKKPKSLVEEDMQKVRSMNSEKKFLEIMKIRLERSADFIGLTKQQIEDIADVLKTVLVDYKVEEW